MMLRAGKGTGRLPPPCCKLPELLLYSVCSGPCFYETALLKGGVSHEVMAVMISS